MIITPRSTSGQQGLLGGAEEVLSVRRARRTVIDKIGERGGVQSLFFWEEGGD